MNAAIKNILALFAIVAATMAYAAIPFVIGYAVGAPVVAAAIADVAWLLIGIGVMVTLNGDGIYQ